MKLPVVYCIFLLVPSCVLAIDPPQQLLRRVKEDQDLSSQVRSIIAARVSHFDAVKSRRQVQVCEPCNEAGDLHARKLGAIPEILSQAKAFANNVIASTTTSGEPEPGSADQLISIIEGDAVGFLSNFTVNDLLNEVRTIVTNSPIVLAGVIGVALVAILPLIILEATSIATGRPVLCLLGASSSILFGGCRRQLELNSFSDNLNALADNFTAYTTTLTGQNATEELTSILDTAAASNVTVALLQNVTISTLITNVTDIVTKNPAVAAGVVAVALVAIIPLLLLESTSIATGRPVLCLLGSSSSILFGGCRRLSTSEELDTDPYTCQLELLSCEMNNALVALQNDE
jgi:hypothetical protein